MNAPMPMSAGADFGPDRLSPARFRTLAQLLHTLGAMGGAEYEEMAISRLRAWAFGQGSRLFDRLDALTEAARALEAVADTIVRGEVRRL